MDNKSTKLNLPSFSPDRFGDIPGPFWITNAEGEILFANVHFLKFFRRTHEQVNGKALEDIIERRTHKELLRLFQSLLKCGETVYEELFLTGGNTTGYFRVTMIPVFDSRNLSYVLCHAFDLTSLKNRGARITRDFNAITGILAKYAENMLPDAKQHLQMISEASAMIAMVLQGNNSYKITKTFIKDIRTASLLHDIGNLEIPSKLLKKQGELSDDEYRIVEEHTTKGIEILKDSFETNSAFFNLCAEIIEYHHEAFDGSGYPHGLSGAEIPLSARIVSVADNYASMRVERPYRKALERNDVLKTISAERGKKLDPLIVEAFLSIENELNALIGLA